MISTVETAQKLNQQSEEFLYAQNVKINTDWSHTHLPACGCSLACLSIRPCISSPQQLQDLRLGKISGPQGRAEEDYRLQDCNDE